MVRVNKELIENMQTVIDNTSSMIMLMGEWKVYLTDRNDFIEDAESFKDKRVALETYCKWRDEARKTPKTIEKQNSNGTYITEDNPEYKEVSLSFVLHQGIEMPIEIDILPVKKLICFDL